VLGISKKAAERGKEVHSVAEEWAKSGNIGRVAAHQGYVDAFQRWVETVKPRASESEVELFSEEYGYAGRCDIVVDINDTLWLIDVKTGKGIYKETGLQLVAYRQALMEMGIAEVDKMGVVLCKEDGEFVFQETKSVIEDFVNVQRVWEWYQKKED